MRNILLISFALVFAGFSWGALGADDFYIIPVPKAHYAPVERSGQTISSAIGDDGDLKKGMIWPTPRFTSNHNGTVTDNLTGLVWLKNANRFSVIRTWSNALADCRSLAAGSDGLYDGSKAGDWRLPNVKELQSLFDYSRTNPILPSEHPFLNVVNSTYWSSTTVPGYNAEYAWYVGLGNGFTSDSAKNCGCYVWPVRDKK